MSDNTNPNGQTTGTVVNLIPRFYQTPDNIKFIQATVDQLVQKGTTKKISGYIGRKNAKSSKGTDVFVETADQTRQNYQLEPSVVINDTTGNTSFFKDYQDYINQLSVFNADVSNHERLNKQEFYSWDPHIDWDKFVNFQQYYWLPYGPETIEIFGQQKNAISTYAVDLVQDTTVKSFVFTPNGLDRNPTIILYRGQTYNFKINSQGEPFSIKTARTLGSGDRYVDGNYIDNFGVESGTITFKVPLNTPDVLFYVSENDANIGGIIQLLDINENSYIDITNELLGKKSYTLSNGTPLSNGMRVKFGGNVTPAEYASGEYYVEGVGTAISLIPVTILEIVSPYSSKKGVTFDSYPFDSYPFSEATSYAGSPDYITINRSSKDHNAWSRYNRWFHADVINASAIYNGAVPSLDQAQRATRPIIEFEANLRLFNFGDIAGADIDLVDDFTTDAFSTIEGSIGYNVDGVQLTDGMRIVFTADTDPLVQNNVYIVKFVNIENNGPGVPQIHLVLDASPTLNQTVLVRQGNQYQGYMFWFNGSVWTYGQQKTKVNQPPLFDLFDKNGESFSSYDGSTFKGTKVFSYAVGNTTADSVLGFSLSYQNINNVGDILFNFNILSDTFSFKKNNILIDEITNVGFLSKLNYNNTASYINGWTTSLVDKYQAAIRIYKNSGLTNEFPLDIYDNKTDLNDLVVRIYINGIRLDHAKWSIVDAPVYKKIKLVTDIATTDVLTIKAFAKQPINANGYYEIPINLQNNPLNSDMTKFTLGEVIDHVNSIIDNLQTNFIGSFPGENNLRDLGDISAYGTKFVQHSGPASLSLYHLTSEANNVVKALEKARDDYGKFKRNFITLAENSGIDTDVVSHVDLILKQLTANKVKLSPCYFSDMVPFGAKKRTDYTVVDERITTYPLSNVFDISVLSNNAVLVYFGEEQLIYGVDYTFTSTGYVDISRQLTLGQTITVYEFDSTDGCYIPATPTKLGLWPAFVPQIFKDNTYLTPQTVIQGHDGSIVVAYNDYRDDLLLELEKRIYNNIKIKYDNSIFDIYSIIPGYNRDTGYSLNEFNNVLAPNFYKWATLTERDFSKPLNFDRTNPFTYNFTGLAAPDGSEVPGYWRGIYRWMFDTDRPHLCPWEMLGFTVQPSWWTTVYGPAPYTNNNLVMWQDLAAGVVREPNKPTVYLSEFARPFLLTHIPVDSSGNLINPILSNLAIGVINDNVTNSYVFGDVAPVESAWRRSSYYPFSILVTAMLLKPSYTFGTCLDRNRIIRNVANQLVYADTYLRVQPSNIVLPSIYSSTARIQTSGILNYLVDALVSDNVNYYSDYQYNLNNLNVQITYRIGGFTSKDNFNLLLDSKNPAATGSLFVPPEDYKIIFNTSSPVKKLSYSGVIITKVGDGFEIKGYSVTQPYFNYHPYTQTSGAINIGGISSPFVAWTAHNSYSVGQIVFYAGKYYRTIHANTASNAFDSTNFQILPNLPVAGGVSATFRKAWDTTTVNVLPYGSVLPTIQSVVDFITGYGEYLKNQGFIFDDFNNNLAQVSNWETSAKEFMFWTTQNWSTGQEKWTDWLPTEKITAGSIVQYNGNFYKALKNLNPSPIFDPTNFEKIDNLDNTGSSVISLSPAANNLMFQTQLSVVDDISNPFNDYEIFQVDGTPLHPMDTDSNRQGNIVTYSPRDNATIYNASFYLIQKEQVVILNNTTMFNDVIYNPTSGYRQERIKTSSFVSAEWFGGFEIPGFIFDRAEINAWQPWTDYALGDIVLYQSNYYSAIAFTSGTAQFDNNNWTQIAKPEQQLLPNWSYKAGQFTDFYNLDQDNFDTGQQKIAQHLIGYQKRQYLDNIIQDDVSEFKFYQGYITEKGTQNSLNKLFDVLSSDNLESLAFYEEWAIRTGSYGATAAYENIEFIIDEPSVTKNPQGFQLLTTAPAIISNNFNITLTPNDLYVKPLGYNSNPFPVVSNFKPFLRTPGYVKLENDTVQLQSFDQLAITPITAFSEGTYLWVAFENTNWNVYRYTSTRLAVAMPTDSTTGNYTHTGVVYNNNVLTITMSTDVDPSLAGSYISIVNVPFAGFYKIASLVKNVITINTTITNFVSPFTSEAELEVFAFQPVRVESIDNANTVIQNYTDIGDKIWTDDRGDGKWANWQLTSVYNSTEIKNEDILVSGYDTATSWTPNTQYSANAVVSSAGYIYKVKQPHKSGSAFNSNVSTAVNTVYLPQLYTINTIVTAGTYLQTNGKLVYLVTTSGTTSANTPTFTSGSQAVGTATLQYQYSLNDKILKVSSTTGIYPGAVISTDGTNGNGFTALSRSVTVVSITDKNTLVLSSAPATTLPTGVMNFTQTGIVPYTDVYTKVFTDNLSAYGRAIAISADGTLAAVSTAKGKVIVFEKQGVTSVWLLRQVIGRAFIAPLDLLSVDPNPASTFGETIAISPDGNYLAIGSPNASYPAVAVDVHGNNVTNASTGVSSFSESHTGAVSLYQKTTFNEYQLVSTFISPTYGSGQQFGSALAFGNGKLFISTKALPNYPLPAIVYELRLINNTYWQFMSSAFSVANVNSTFGQSIAVTKDNTVLAITDPSDSALYIYKLISSTGMYTLSQTITDTTASFGTSISISDYGDRLAVGSVYYSGSLTYQGKVNVYKFLQEPVTAGSFETGITYTIATVGNTNFTSVGSTNNQVGNVFVATGAGSGTGTATTLSYVLDQQLTSPKARIGDFFGSKVLFMNDYNTLVVYSSNADISTPAPFNDGTSFDGGGFKVADLTTGAGRIEIYDIYNTKYIRGEILLTTSGSLDEFGQGLAAANNRILVGAPNATSGLLNLNLGKVFSYEKLPGTYSWKQIHNQIDIVDLTKIKQAFLYNRVTNQLIQHLDIIDPYLGKIAGAAEQEITYKTFYDPAIYTQGDSTVNVDTGLAWGSKQVGKLWWDLRTAKFIDNHTEDLVYRNSSINQLVVGASIDIYEWVETTLLPADWAKQADTSAGLTLGISGTPLYGNNVYSTKQTFNTFSNSLKNTYYYWVKNSAVVPAIVGRSLSASTVSSLISNPRGQGYQFLSITGPDSFAISNCQSLLKDTEVVLAIEYWLTDKTDQNIHHEWKLISDDPSTVLPSAIEEKWFDSLCGKDQADRVVPDYTQPVKLRYGIEFRPRQSMFVNRFEALKQFVEQTNLTLIANPIVEQKDISDLELYDIAPAAVTGLYDSTVDTDAELVYASISLAKPAAVSAVIVNGSIVGIEITSPGFGYKNAPDIVVTGTGTGAKLKAILNSKGQITGANIISGGKGYDPRISPTTGLPYTKLSIRTYSVLVKSDSVANGNWSIYAYDSTAKVWQRTKTQSYNVSAFWNYADWYGSYTDTTTNITTTYNQFTKIDWAVDTYNELQDISPSIGQIVKVRTTGSGGWQLLRYTANVASYDWTLSYTVVGIQNGTLQLSSNLYNFQSNSIGYDGYIYDNSGFDYSAGVELRIILNALKNKILTDTLKQNYLDLFFSSVRYAFSEQTYIDWAFKTSFVKSEHNVGMLRQTVTYTNDNLSNFEDYVNEVVPYKTTVRKYVSNYQALDNTNSAVSDFDLPAVYNSVANTVIKTEVTDGKIQAYDPAVQSYPWKNWLDYVGFQITNIEISNGGSGYTTAPVVRIISDSGTGATATAFINSGVVNRIVVTNPGSGYLTAPTILLDGGVLTPPGVVATANAIIGNSVVRSSLIKMKFDRITQTYSTIQLDATQTFVGTGTQLYFPLTWAPDIKVGTSTVTVNNIIQLRDTYTLSVIKSTSKGYTSYTGMLTFTNSAPVKQSVISITYIKDVSLLSAADRIQYYYNPTAGQIGKDLSQLMTGVDYGGTIISGVDFSVAEGWNSVGYMSDLWDSYENTYSNYIVTVDSTTQQSHLFVLPYTPDVYSNINVYYSQVINNTYTSDGNQQIYTFSPLFNAVSITATIEKETGGVSGVATSTSTATSTITQTISSNNALKGPTSGLTVGQPVVFIFGNLGGIVPNQTYYIYSIIDSHTFTIGTTASGPQVSLTDATGTMYMQYNGNNTYITADATKLTSGMPIQFSGNVFGGITAGQTYYVITRQPTYFSVSATITNGVPGTPVAVTYAQGSMSFNQINGVGSKVLQLSDTTGLHIGDAPSVSIAGVISPGTVITSIVDDTHIKLNTIIYGDIPALETVTFTRTLSNPTDYRYLTNTTIKLASPLVFGATLLISSTLDPIRLDDPNYGKTWTITSTNGITNALTASAAINIELGNPIVFTSVFDVIKANETYYVNSIIDSKHFTISGTLNGPTLDLQGGTGSMIATAIANPNAVMQTYTADGRAPEIVIPATFTLNVGDLVILRQSTSDGSVPSANTDIDTSLDGGDLAYTTASGLNPDDILVDGDGFATPSSSPAPEEVVPGQLFDACAIKVFNRPTDGSAKIINSNYVADGVTRIFGYGQFANSKQAIIVKVGTTYLTNSVDYNVDYDNKQIILNSVPNAGVDVFVSSIGFNGTGILDLDYFVGDGSTNEFITNAEWQTDFNALVYLNGVAITPEIFKTDATYENSNRIGFRFIDAPLPLAVLTYLIVSGNQQTYSIIKEERLPTDGTTTTFTLSNTIGATLPLESNILVRVNQKILQGPNNSYFTISGNKYTYALDITKVQPYSVNTADLKVYANGKLLILNQDYTVDTSVVSVSLNRKTYSAYKGTRLTISLPTKEGYSCTNETITFNQAYLNSDYVEVTSAYRHDILSVERTQTTVSSNIQFSSATASFYNYVGILGGNLPLGTSVISEDFLYVIKNGSLLTPSVDYSLNSDLSSIKLSTLPQNTDLFEFVAFTGSASKPAYSYMQFKDMLNRTVYKRISKKKQTRLAADLHYYDSTITVEDAGNFDKPNPQGNRPGIIEIHGERIEFFTINGNVLGQLRRGTLGTGTPAVHKSGIIVQEIGPAETVPYSDDQVTEQVIVDGTTVTTVIPLSFVPAKSSTATWNLTGNQFEIFSSTTSNAVISDIPTGSGNATEVTFVVPQLTYAPAVGKTLTVSNSINTSYNGNYVVSATNTSTSVTYVPTNAVVTGIQGIVVSQDGGNSQTVSFDTFDDAGVAGSAYTISTPVIDGSYSDQLGIVAGVLIAYSFIIPTQDVPPTTGIYYTVTGAVPTQYNGSWICTASSLNSITLEFTVNYGAITTIPTSVASAHQITLLYPTDPGTFISTTPVTIAAPTYGQADGIEVFVGGYDSSTVWTANTVFNAGQILTVNEYTYLVLQTFQSGNSFNSPVSTVSVDGSTVTVIATGVPVTSVLQFFVGNIRLKKYPYAVQNSNVAPYSPEGDVSFQADFAVDGTNSELVLTNTLSPGTVVTVVRRKGAVWANDTGDISTSTSAVANFIKQETGAGYSNL